MTNQALSFLFLRSGAKSKADDKETRATRREKNTKSTERVTRETEVGVVRSGAKFGCGIMEGTSDHRNQILLRSAENPTQLSHDFLVLGPIPRTEKSCESCVGFSARHTLCTASAFFDGPGAWHSPLSPPSSHPVHHPFIPSSLSSSPRAFLLLLPILLPIPL